MQNLLVLPVIGAGLMLELIAPRFARKAKLRSIVTAALMLTVLGSIVPQLLEGNDFGNYLRVLLPFLLFLLGYRVMCHPWHDQRIGQIEKVLFWANVLCLLFTLAYGIKPGHRPGRRPLPDCFPHHSGPSGCLAPRIRHREALYEVLHPGLPGHGADQTAERHAQPDAGTLLLLMLATWLGAPSIIA